MARTIGLFLALAVVGVLGGCDSAGGGGGMGDAGAMFTKFMGGGTLDDPTIVSGLKEALEVGTGNAVTSTSRPDGYWGNMAIRIVMPERLQVVGATLRKVGLGAQVDSFEHKMNEAAEAAASQAGGIFVDAIRQMTFDDARTILMGSNTAATDYFRVKTSASLKATYMPVVSNRMRELGVVTAYNGLLAKYTAIPLVSKPDLPRIEEYVTDKALEGLFKVVADEERQIRENPAARTTALLKKVFGSRR